MILAYLAGLATLPAVAGLFMLGVLFLHPPHWDHKGPCPWCDMDKRWVQSDHPWWPWWLWRIVEVGHQVRHREYADIRAWRAEHTEKAHWWSRRVVVR